VFFAFPNEISGKELEKCIYKNIDISENILYKDLSELKNTGKNLNLLLNASCYGQYAVTVELQKRLYNIFIKLQQHKCYPDIVTTASPFIAKFIRKNIKNVKIRMSIVNDISSVDNLRYSSDLFDGYYISPSINRNLHKLKIIKEWCDLNNKDICILANSACLANCPYTHYHYNIISHYHEI
jgi:hypothetical protein